MDRFYPLKGSKEKNVINHLLDTVNTGWFHGDLEVFFFFSFPFFSFSSFSPFFVNTFLQRTTAEERLKGREVCNS